MLLQEPCLYMYILMNNHPCSKVCFKGTVGLTVVLFAWLNLLSKVSSVAVVQSSESIHSLISLGTTSYYRWSLFTEQNWTTGLD